MILLVKLRLWLSVIGRLSLIGVKDHPRAVKTLSPSFHPGSERMVYIAVLHSRGEMKVRCLQRVGIYV